MQAQAFKPSSSGCLPSFPHISSSRDNKGRNLHMLETSKMEAVIDIATEHHTSNNGDLQCQSRPLLVSSMRKELEKLSPLSSECCIYRAPERMRKHNVQAYTPQTVSIGPLHYNQKKEYKAMEEHKWRYLQKFLDTAEMSLEDALEFIKERQTRIRNCYAPTIDLESDDFLQMVLLDATFILYILCGDLLIAENDRLYGRSRMIGDLMTDIFLLENQLPFFILVDLFQVAKATADISNQWPSIFELFHRAFVMCPQNNSLPMEIEGSDIKHMVDLLRRCYLPTHDLSPRKFDFKLVPTVTELHEAGVKFKVASTKKLSEVHFANGVLEFPRHNLNFRTEVAVRNVLAFEQCHCTYMYMTQYFVFMDGLINTPKDMELLIRFGIVVNELGDNEEASTLFNSLSKGLIWDTNNFYLCTLFENLTAYYKVPRRKWIATLKHEYFKNPWKIISTFAGIIFLVLTIIQAVCSIISVS